MPPSRHLDEILSALHKRPLNSLPVPYMKTPIRYSIFPSNSKPIWSRSAVQSPTPSGRSALKPVVALEPQVVDLGLAQNLQEKVSEKAEHWIQDSGQPFGSEDPVIDPVEHP